MEQVSIFTPIISRNVSPLKYTLGAGEVLGQPIVHLEHLVTSTGLEGGAMAVRLD